MIAIAKNLCPSAGFSPSRAIFRLATTMQAGRPAAYTTLGFVWCRAAIFLFALLYAPLLSGFDQDRPPFRVEDWLAGPDHEDMPWDVRVLSPQLTFQQRHLVPVRAEIDCGRLQERDLRRDLHFILKVADADQRWFSGYDYTHLAVPPGLSKSDTIEYSSGVYLRPGRYTIALLAYDLISKQSNVWRKTLTVPEPKNDPLPELDRKLADVEFIPKAPIFDDSTWLLGRSAVWPMGKGMEWLPVKNKRSLDIELVVDVSAYYSTYMRMPIGAFNYQLHTMHLLQISSVLSHLHLQNGRVRITILDTLRMKTLFAREDAAGFDWRSTSEILAKQDQASIEARVLSSQTNTSAYLLDRLKESMKGNGLSAENQDPFKVVIIVGSGLQFPEHTRIQRVILEHPDSTRFFYFCVGLGSNDDLAKMLKPTKPRQFQILEPRAFRNALADFISALEKLQ
jgi:hypothetical protein